MATPIRDISDKGVKEGKRMRYEVCFFYTGNDETPDVYAKFRKHGDAVQYANFLAQKYAAHEILIRS